MHVQPNCFVQPVLSTHGDKEMPSICFFAMRNIPPMEELAYDYGAGYIETRLGGRCHCGDAVCTFAGSPASTPAHRQESHVGGSVREDNQAP